MAILKKLNIFKRLKTYFTIWNMLKTHDSLVLEVAYTWPYNRQLVLDRIRYLKQNGECSYSSISKHYNTNIELLKRYKHYDMPSIFYSCFIRDKYVNGGQIVFLNNATFNGKRFLTLFEMVKYDLKEGLHIVNIYTKHQHIAKLKETQGDI